MRAPKRINKFLEEVGEVWKKVPDWRFGQLMSNFFRWYNRDPFFLEEDKFIELLRQYFGEEMS